MSRANPRFRRFNQKLPPPVEDVYRVKVFGRIEQQMTISTFYYQGSKLTGQSVHQDLVDVAAGFQALGGVYPKYLAAVSSDWGAVEIAVDSPTTPSLNTYHEPDNSLGGGPAVHLPSEVAAVLIRRTNFKGQCGRGRISLPAVPGVWTSLSEISNTAAYDLLATAIVSSFAVDGTTYTPVLFSRNGSRQVPGVGVADLESCNLQALLGTIRRRRIGRGK